MKIQPLGDKVLVKQLESEEKTKSGIVLPEIAKEKPQEGKVIAVGSGKLIDGKIVTLEVKEGDKIIFSGYPNEVKIENEEYLILSESDILAIIK